MVRTTDEFVAEAKRRAVIILKKRAERRKRILTACVSLLTAGLIILAGAMLPPGSGKVATAAWGLELTEPDVITGGYVLAGVIAFTAGAAVTVLCLRIRRKSL